MATLRRSSGQAKKKAKKTKVKAKKKVIKAKKKVVKAKKVVKKKVSAKKKALVKKVAKKVTAKMLGKVVHYYDRIGVAIVELNSPLKLGENVKFKRGEMELVQQVVSMQIEHAPVAAAKKGDVIGMKVSRPVQQGTQVLPT